MAPRVPCCSRTSRVPVTRVRCPSATTARGATTTATTTKTSSSRATRVSGLLHTRKNDNVTHPLATKTVTRFYGYVRVMVSVEFRVGLRDII